MSCLKINNLTLKFGGVTAIDSVNVEVIKGQVFSIIGPNGAGKTSLFNTITGIYLPTEGKIFFQGKELKKTFSFAFLIVLGVAFLLSGFLVLCLYNIEYLWEQIIINDYIYQEPFNWQAAFVKFQAITLELMQDHNFWIFFNSGLLASLAMIMSWKHSVVTPHFVSRKGLSRTFQNIRLFPQMTVAENVLMAAESRNRKSAASITKELLELTELTRHSEQLSTNLPYGLQRRLEIARAMALNPEILLLDEPAAGMNPSEAKELVELIAKIKKRGITIILIEHHMKVVMDISDRIAVLDYGNKIAEGTPEEIKQNPQVIKAYLGSEDE
ncbi:MAG: ABC transporter ATP-binding protein [Proteobacteria bacterium]|nr:ABC transporter ATP-binding protein [Pseudomonadota bacterium]